MYLKKISPCTTCLYSAASMLLRSLSAVSQSLASKPRFAAVPFEGPPPAAFFFAMLFRRGVDSLMPELDRQHTEQANGIPISAIRPVEQVVSASINEQIQAD